MWLLDKLLDLLSVFAHWRFWGAFVAGVAAAGSVHDKFGLADDHPLPIALIILGAVAGLIWDWDAPPRWWRELRFWLWWRD